jgi:tRNA dimethylallyltransferase
VDDWYKKDGIAVINQYLEKFDPDSLVNYHQNDHYRLMRAVEHYEATGTKISMQKKEFDILKPYDFSTIIHPWEILHIYLDVPRDLHFQIITNRTKKMFSDGLLNEINQLELEGFTLDEKPLASIGYKEAIEWKKGVFDTLEQCIEKISISTGQLAKAQRTFFNKITPKESFNPLLDQAKIMERVILFIKAKE